jgi:hypothetical protein
MSQPTEAQQPMTCEEGPSEPLPPEEQHVPGDYNAADAVSEIPDACAEDAPREILAELDRNSQLHEDSQRRILRNQAESEESEVAD